MAETGTAGVVPARDLGGVATETAAHTVAEADETAETPGTVAEDRSGWTNMDLPQGLTIESLWRTSAPESVGR